MVNRSVVQFTDTDAISHAGYEQSAEDTAEQALINIISDLSGSAAGTQDIHIRDADPKEDLGVYTDGPNAEIVTADSPDFTVTIGTGEDGQYNSFYAFKNDADMEDKAAVLYGFQFLEDDETSECPVAQVRIDTENAGRIGSLDLTGAEQSEDGVVLIEDPLEVKKDDFFLETYIKSGFADSDFRFKPLIKVAEQPAVLGNSQAFVNTN